MIVFDLVCMYVRMYVCVYVCMSVYVMLIKNSSFLLIWFTNYCYVRDGKIARGVFHNIIVGGRERDDVWDDVCMADGWLLLSASILLISGGYCSLESP